MAASSSSMLVPSSFSSSLGLMRYQVFLNFRGEDTRTGFAKHLYKALEHAGIHTFFELEEIEGVENIMERLYKAVEESRYCVVILSKGYADSKWCLKELAYMFEQKKEIFPVFYYVKPSDVRHQSGPFELSFRNHEVGLHSAYVEEWRQAMTKVGQLKGFVNNHQSNKKEVELIEEIVESMVRCRDNLLYVADHPVGMDSRVEDVMKLLNIEEGGVRMVGIYGMGGVGKTTLAKEIHNRLLRRFDRAIYIEGIKEKRDRLPKLQEEFISKAFRPGNLNICNSSEGVTEIRRRFRHSKVLAVLDDIDHRDQLKALAGACDWFGEGTRVLITTRDERLLDAHHVDKKYEVQELNSRESLQLFSWYAFKNDQPSEEYMEKSEQVAKAAGGLPLALEVLGSSLSKQNDTEAWEEVETMLRGSAYSDIDKCLRRSYDGLNPKEQNIFLDIACFFLGEKKEHAIDVWKGCHFDAPVSTVNSLLRKCLLKVDKLGRLYMHDLLRDMGRHIVKEGSPVIGSRSRLWDQEEVWDVLEEHQGTDKIEGIICQKKLEGGEILDVEAFANMSNLRFLHLEDINLMGDFSRMPRSLRSLKWKRCSMKMLPDNFNLQKVGHLDLSFSNIVQVWSDSCISKKKVLTNLRVLDLSECDVLVMLPDFSHSVGLEKLCLQGCSRLMAIPESIGNLTKLKMLDLTRCTSLSSLPSSIGSLSKLECLVLVDCISLSTLPNPIENLTKLRTLDLRSCRSLSALPNSIGCMTRIEELVLDFCISLSTLPSSIGNLTKLRTLNVHNCLYLLALPNSIGNLTGLEELTLSMCTSLSTLPNSIGNLTRLKMLRVFGCESLLALPNSIGNLTGLEELVLADCLSLSTLPNSIGNLTGLVKLDARNCESLSALPNSIGNLTRLESLILASCVSLSTLPSSIGNMRRLSTLDLCKSGTEELPYSVRLLELLEWLGIVGCRLQGRLPLWEMKCLKRLSIGGEVNQKDESDNGDGNQNEVCEIPEGITHYSQQTQEYRRIQYIDTLDFPLRIKCPLSIWVVGSQEREIVLLVYPPREGWKGQPWLEHIFPDNFTPQYDTKALEACASNSSVPDGSANDRNHHF